MEVTSSEKEKAAVPEKPSMTTEEMYSIRDHWKCLAACTLVSMCPFQYGLDFGLIGGLQAMIGFLKVRSIHLSKSCKTPRIDSKIGVWT